MIAKDQVSILIVDDQSSRLLTYETILEDLGENLIRAYSGTEALQRVMKEEFAVILLDVNMPGMDGFETATLIHRHPRFEKTPIIFVTGVHVTDLDRLHGYKLGAVDYVYIPIVPEILRSKVAVLVELYRKRRELQRLNRSLELANEELGRANEALEAEIAERQRAEETLLQLAAIVQSSDDAIISWSLDSHIISWNRGAERIYGYAAKEAVGRPISLLMPPDHPDEAPQILRRLRRGEAIDQYETVRVRKDGRRIDVSITYSPISDLAGQITGVSVIAHDVTDRKKAEERIRKLNEELEQRVVERTVQLQAANEELESFSYSIAHDLRAPLRAMDGFSRIVLEDYATQLPPEAQGALQRVRANTEQMSRLVDDLLDFSRLSRQPLIKKATAPADLVRESLQDLCTEQVGRQVEISVGDLPTCEADPSLFKQVWINLLSNALKYTRRRDVARIDVGCRNDNGLSGERVYFVRDNGVGFDMQQAQTLFGVFQRFHRAEDYEGTGVGLAITQRIIRRHGGRIWAEAEPNRGAAFYFTVGANGAHE